MPASVWTGLRQRWEQHRIDAPQGEKLEDGVRQPDAVAEVLPQFIPLPTESRVVIPPADEPGKGETRVREVGDDAEHEFAGLGRPVEEDEAPACRDGQELPGMELDSVEDAEADLRELMAVMTRDAKDEIKKHDDDIFAVVRALGGSVGKYRRERQKGIRAIVAEV